MQLRRIAALCALLSALCLFPRAAAEDENQPYTEELPAALVRAADAIAEAMRNYADLQHQDALTGTNRYKSQVERAKKNLKKDQERLATTAKREIDAMQRKLQSSERELEGVKKRLEKANDKAAPALEKEADKIERQAKRQEALIAAIRNQLDISHDKLSNERPHALEGSSLPAFSAVGLNGKAIASGDYRGKYLFLIFWNTRNADSVKYVTDLNSAATVLKRKDAEILIVALGNDEGDVKKVLGDRRWNLDFALPDPKGKSFSDTMHVQLLPTTYFVGPGGEVIRAMVGTWANQKEDLRKMLEKHIADEEKKAKAAK